MPNVEPPTTTVELFEEKRAVRAYKMDGERFRRLMEEMTEDLVAERQNLPGPGGPRCC